MTEDFYEPLLGIKVENQPPSFKAEVMILWKATSLTAARVGRKISGGKNTFNAYALVGRAIQTVTAAMMLMTLLTVSGVWRTGTQAFVSLMVGDHPVLTDVHGVGPILGIVLGSWVAVVFADLSPGGLGVFLVRSKGKHTNLGRVLLLVASALAFPIMQGFGIVSRLSAIEDVLVLPYVHEHRIPLRY